MMELLQPNLLTSFVAFGFVLLVLRGLVPLVGDGIRDDVYHFCMGLIWIFLGILLSLAYWDVIRTVVRAIDQDAWRAWSRMIDGTTWSNTIRNLCWISGAMHVLRAFLAMIPADERHRWNRWTAPFYPHGWCFNRLANTFRRFWRSK